HLSRCILAYDGRPSISIGTSFIDQSSDLKDLVHLSVVHITPSAAHNLHSAPVRDWSHGPAYSGHHLLTAGQALDTSGQLASLTSSHAAKKTPSPRPFSSWHYFSPIVRM
ncbi:hypothetical protein BgiBS90_018633, partial [Biomphalaria glabrata]